MRFLVCKAFLELVRFDLYLARGHFGTLYNAVINCPVNNQRSFPNSVERICSAMDMASIWYWKKALCLQRSAATTCLLKRHGVHAQLVIGVQRLPFAAHAWVEVNGHVVNDKPYTPERYAVLDRC
jgi:hypothetical protein